MQVETYIRAWAAGRLAGGWSCSRGDRMSSSGGCSIQSRSCGLTMPCSHPGYTLGDVLGITITLGSRLKAFPYSLCHAKGQNVRFLFGCGRTSGSKSQGYVCVFVCVHACVCMPVCVCARHHRPPSQSPATLCLLAPLQGALHKGHFTRGCGRFLRLTEIAVTPSLSSGGRTKSTHGSRSKGSVWPRNLAMRCMFLKSVPISRRTCWCWILTTTWTRGKSRAPIWHGLKVCP